MAMNEKGKNKIHKFQVVYMLNTGLKFNKAFREQVESNLDLKSDSKIGYQSENVE